MGYVHQEHRCFLPPVAGQGDIWVCEECGKYWRSYAPGNPAYNAWKPIGPIGRWVLGLAKAGPS